MGTTNSSKGARFTPVDTGENDLLDAAERVGRRQGRKTSDGGQDAGSGDSARMGRSSRAASGNHRKSGGSGGVRRHAKPVRSRKPAREATAPAEDGSEIAEESVTPVRVKKRRSPLHLALIALNALLLVAVLAAGGLLGFGQWRLSQLRSYDLAENGLTAVPAGAPFNVLLVGSDARPTGEDPEVVGQRSDTMMVVRLDPVQKSAAVLSIPRDVRVLDDKGNVERINAKFNGAGAEAPRNLIRGIQGDFGIPIHHYVQVDFESFKAIVDSIDGVNVYFSERVRDKMSGLPPVGPGCAPLNGEHALAYARSRHTEVYNTNTGRWGNDEGADSERIKRQQDLLRRIVKKSIDRGLTNPVVANRLIDAMVNNVTVDSALTTARMKTMVQQMRGISAADIPMYTLPGMDVNKDGTEFKGGPNYAGLKLTPAATPVLAKFGSQMVVGPDYPHHTTSTTTASTTRRGSSTTGVSTTTSVAPTTTAAEGATTDTKPPQGSDPSMDCPA